jgi:hypothetical protein
MRHATIGTTSEWMEPVLEPEVGQTHLPFWVKVGEIIRVF